MRDLGGLRQKGVLSHGPISSPPLPRDITGSPSLTCPQLLLWGISDPTSLTCPLPCYEGMTMANYDITGLRAIFNALQNHYPERLYKFYL